MNYKKKYLKYKFKYLNLKKKGGSNEITTTLVEDPYEAGFDLTKFLYKFKDDISDTEHNFSDLIDDDTKYQIIQTINLSENIHLLLPDITCCSFYNCTNTLPIIPKLICDSTIGFNNAFGTCWLLSILQIFFFSDSTSNCVQHVIINKDNITRRDTSEFNLLLLHFPEIANNIKLNNFIEAIKHRFINKVYEKNLYKVQDDKLPSRRLSRQISFELELDLGILINEMFNFHDNVQHGILYKNKTSTDNIKKPIYGGDTPLSFCVSNILGCLLLNRLITYTILSIHPIIVPIDYSQIHKSIGIIIQSIKLDGFGGHTCCFIECNNTKVFVNNNFITPYRWDLLFALCNTLLEHGISDYKIIYDFTNKIPGPMISINSDLYYIYNDEIKVCDYLLKIDNFNNYFTCTSFALLQFDNNTDIFYKNNFIEILIFNIYFNNYTKLHYIIELHNNEIKDQVTIDEKVNINNLNNYYSSIIIGIYPLIYACIKGYYEIVSILLSYKFIDVNVIDQNNITPILYACQYNYTNIVHILLEHLELNLSCLNASGDTALHIVCNNENLDIVSLLLHHPRLEINEKNITGDTALHIACNNENLDIVTLLLHHPRLEINTQNIHGETALHIVCSNENINILDLLVQNSKLDGNYINALGNTALHIACNNNNDPIVIFLLSITNININYPDASGNSALHIACINGYYEIVKELLNQKTIIDINYTDAYGNSALHIACIKGYYKIAKLLLTNNTINKNIINNNGETPLDIVNYIIQLNDNRKIKYIKIQILLDNQINTQNAIYTSNNNDKSYISVKKTKI